MNSSINKKLILSDLNFRHNSSCFFIIFFNTENSSKQSQSRTGMCLWEAQARFVTESISLWLNLLAILGLLLKYILLFLSPNHFKYQYSMFNVNIKTLLMHLWQQDNCIVWMHLNATSDADSGPLLHYKHKCYWYWFHLIGNNPIVFYYFNLMIQL